MRVCVCYNVCVGFNYVSMNELYLYLCVYMCRYVCDNVCVCVCLRECVLDECVYYVNV